MDEFYKHDIKQKKTNVKEYVMYIYERLRKKGKMSLRVRSQISVTVGEQGVTESVKRGSCGSGNVLFLYLVIRYMGVISL